MGYAILKILSIYYTDIVHAALLNLKLYNKVLVRACEIISYSPVLQNGQTSHVNRNDQIIKIASRKFFAFKIETCMRCVNFDNKFQRLD